MPSGNSYGCGGTLVSLEAVRRFPHCRFNPLHAHFCPPLLRSPTVRNLVVGYEFPATSKREITAEGPGQRVREVGDFHYLDLTR